MSVKIYDASIGAFKDASTPLVWDEQNQAYKDSTGLVWNESAQAWEERWSLHRDLIVGKDIKLSDGTFKNCTPSYFNGDDGAAGFTITGRAANTYGNGWYYKEYTYLRWDLSLDFSNLTNIVFSGKKNANHGKILVKITDGLQNAPNTGYYPQTVRYGGIEVGYEKLDTSWHEYSIDTSEISGTHVLSFVGGYTDDSGSSASSTSYKNIIFKS